MKKASNKSYDRDILSLPQLEIIKMVQSGSRVLEVGCATGYMTRVFSDEKNCSVTAVEIDPDQAERARPYAEKLIVGDVVSPEVWDQLKSERFDHIVFADVLEHLVNPWEMLENCQELLGEGGTVLASIPNVAYFQIRLQLLFGRFEYRDFGILDDTHLRFFTEKTTRELFIRSGYKVNRFLRALKGDRYRIVRLFPNLFTYQFVLSAQKADKIAA